jgi:hypothetical protein
MAIKQYPNKSSVLKRKTRYLQGGFTDLKKKRLGWWERREDIATNDVTDIVVPITSRYANRPDLIAYDYYGDAALTWIVLQYNSIVDTLTELAVGKEITIPSADRVYYSVMVNSIRVQDTTTT